MERNLFATAQQEAYTYVREKILAGEYAGGARLNPGEIAEALNISRMPVREALRQLDAEGLVAMPPNRSAVVTRLTPADVEELFEMRAVLEALAVRFAAPNLDAVALSELTMLKERMDRVRAEPKVWIKHHDEFHQFLCNLSGRPRLAREIARIRTAAQPYLLMSISVYSTSEREGYEHDALVRAITSGNVDDAEIATRDHVRLAARDIIDFLKGRDLESARHVPAPALGESHEHGGP